MGAEQFVKALTRFHYRETDRFRSEIKREKRPKVPYKTTNTDVTRFSKTKKETHSVNRESNETINNIYKIAENLQKRIAEFNNLMSTVKGKENKQFKQYTCLFSESLNNDGVKRKQLTKQLSNRKRKDRIQIKNNRNINAQFEANKNHINFSKKIGNHGFNVGSNVISFSRLRCLSTQNASFIHIQKIHMIASILLFVILFLLVTYIM